MIREQYLHPFGFPLSFLSYCHRGLSIPIHYGICEDEMGSPTHVYIVLAIVMFWSSKYWIFSNLIETHQILFLYSRDEIGSRE